MLTVVFGLLSLNNLKAFTRDDGLFDKLSFYMNDFMEYHDIVQLFIVKRIEVAMFTFLHPCWVE